MELLGALTGSGYEDAPSLVRRVDGQTLQLTPLLYAVLDAVDGRRNHAQIAAVVSERIGKQAEAEDVAYLIEEKLRPLGVLQTREGLEPLVEKSNPLLSLRFRYVVSNPRVTRKITRPFALLFRPWLVVPLLAAFAVISGWVLFEYGLASATHDALYKPGLLLLIFALTMLSAGFHEFGHAAACRYGGATPGAMGAGLYLVWPAFYTDVTDSYRLERRGRLRVDVGGLYFNAIFAVVTFAVWWFTRWDSLLLVIPAQLLQMVRQLLPFVRFDGYHILADLTGVPDLFSHLKPTVLGLLPKRWHQPAQRPLKRWARIVVTTWVLMVIPVLAFSLVMMVKIMPRVAATAWDSLGIQWDVLLESWAAGSPADVAVRILAMLTIALPVVSMAYILGRIVRRTVRKAWRWSAGHRIRRSIVVAAGLALVGLLVWAWWPHGQYEPIDRQEAGTIIGGFDPLPLMLPAQPVAATQFAAPNPVAPSIYSLVSMSSPPRQMVGPMLLPAASLEPRIGIVLVPTEEAGDEVDPQVIVLPEPTGVDSWAFPFNPPREPREHDNQALAVNTTDGSSLYDVALALVWVTDAGYEHVDHRNEAYALASCSNCQTVAVAFEVLLIVGQANVIIPENIAVAVNYNCYNCTSYALAVQLIATLTDMPSEEGMARLEAIWAELETLMQNIEEIPLNELHALLIEFERRILQVLVEDEGASATTNIDEQTDTPTPSPTATEGATEATSTESADPTETATAGTEASATSEPVEETTADAAPATAETEAPAEETSGEAVSEPTSEEPAAEPVEPVDEPTTDDGSATTSSTTESP